MGGSRPLSAKRLSGSKRPKSLLAIAAVFVALHASRSKSVATDWTWLSATSTATLRLGHFEEFPRQFTACPCTRMRRVSPKSGTRCEAESGDETGSIAASAGRLAGVWCILATEFGERFSYYGLRAVLTLYFVSIGNTEAQAVSLFAYTSALAYLMPLLGGVVADVFWGRYRTILVFTFVYVFGSLALALSAATGGGNEGALAALLFISIGTGGIKPCVSAFGADQLGPNDEAARARYFSNFYLAINAGSTLSFLVTPVLRVTFGFPMAFAASAAVLSMSLLVFVSGNKSYRRLPPGGSLYRTSFFELRQWLSILVGGQSYFHLGAKDSRVESGAVPAQKLGNQKQSSMEEAPAPEEAPSKSSVDEDLQALASVKRLVPVLLLMPCFWALFDQQGSAWVLQAKAMRLSGLLPLGLQLTPEMLQICNPIFVMLLLPLTSKLFDSWQNIFSSPPPKPLRKMVCGMVVAALAFVCSAGVQWLVDTQPAGSVFVLWQLPQLFLITLGEVLVSVVSLEYFYAGAPIQAKAVVTALALLTVSVGDILCGVLYQCLAPVLAGPQLLLTFAGLMLVNAAILSWVARTKG